MTPDIFTLSIDKEILLISSDVKEVRKKITALKKEKTPSFIFCNNSEQLTFTFTKKINADGYTVIRVLGHQPIKFPTKTTKQP